MGFEVGFVVLLATIIVGRIISHRALQELSSEQKAMLMDTFSGYQAYALIPFLVLLAAFYVLERFTDLALQLLVVGYFAALLGYIGWGYLHTKQKLDELELPAAYRTKYGLARAIQYAGLGIFFVAVFTTGY